MSRSKRGEQPTKKDFFERISDTASRTAIVAAAASILAVSSTIWEAHGKFVILPFDVKGDIEVKSTIGESIASGLSRSIGQLNYIYKTDFSTNIDKQPRFEVIPSYLSEIPLSAIPHAISISEATTLSHLNIFGLDIPLGEIIFKYLRFFSHNYIHGTVETWGGESIVNVEMGNGQKFVITADKSKGFIWIIDMVSAEVLNRQKWLNLPPTKTPSLMYFTRGLWDYIQYSQYGDQELLESAKQSYKRAIEIDPSFALARLHLAVTQYGSWNSSDLISAITNFSALIDDPELHMKARIGLAAALLRHMERDRDCKTYDRDLERASAVANALPNEAGIAAEELFLKAGVERKTIDRKLNNAECRDQHRQSTGASVTDAESTFDDILSKCDEAFRSIRKDPNQDYRFISILLLKKYSLEDFADYLISANRPKDALSILYADKKVTSEVEDAIDSLPAWQSETTFPYLKGTFAEMDLKIAYVNNLLATSFSDELKDAEISYRGVEYGGHQEASKWAIGRAGELLYSEGRLDGALDSLNEYINADRHNDMTVNYFDDNSAKYGALLEREDVVCDLTKGLTDLVRYDQRSVFQQILLADIYVRHGNIPQAKDLLESAEFSYSNNYLWYGPPIGQLLKVLEIEVKAEEGYKEEAIEMFKRMSNFDPNNIGPYRNWLATLPNYQFVSVVRAVQALSRITPFQDVLDVTISSRPALGELIAARGKRDSLVCRN